MNIKGQMKAGGVIGIIALVVVAIVVTMVLVDRQAAEPAADPTVDDAAIGITECSSETTPDVLINAFDVDNQGTAIVDVGVYRKVGTVTWNRFFTGTEIQGLEPNTKYEVALGVNATATPILDRAYGPTFELTTKCKEDDTVEYMMYNDEIETSITGTFYNDDDNAAAESFSAGDIKTVSVVWKAGKDEYFGNPGIELPNVLVLQMNKSQAETPVEVWYKTTEGAEVTLDRISLPQVYANQTALFTEWAYEAPSVGDRDVEIFMELESDPTNALNQDGTAFLFPGNYYIDDDGDVASGVEDEDGNPTAVSNADPVTLDFT